MLLSTIWPIKIVPRFSYIQHQRGKGAASRNNFSGLYGNWDIVLKLVAFLEFTDFRIRGFNSKRWDKNECMFWDFQSLACTRNLFMSFCMIFSYVIMIWYQWSVNQYSGIGKYLFILQILIMYRFMENSLISISMLSIKKYVLIYWYFHYFTVPFLKSYESFISRVLI